MRWGGRRLFPLHRRTDASYFLVVAWCRYYSILVLDDFPRFVLASDLKTDMTAHSIRDVEEQAVVFSGMRQVPVEDPTKVLSEYGSGYVARVFEESLRVLENPAHLLRPASIPDQGQDRALSRGAQARMNLLVYTSPDELRRTMLDFIVYYNHRRYHEAIGNATPADRPPCDGPNLRSLLT